MAPSVEKKIAELEMGLLHLQQNIEIPEISLPIHATITNVAKQCYERGEKPKVTDFGEKAEDPLFLNQLQSGVNRWIREIQKVTQIKNRGRKQLSNKNFYIVLCFFLSLTDKMLLSAGYSEDLRPGF